MTATSTPALPTAGRHRLAAGARTGAFDSIPAELHGQYAAGAFGDPGRRGARHGAPATSLGRAARTAGLSLAALGALSTVGGVSAHALAAAEGTGDDTGHTQLAAADLNLKPQGAPAADTISAPAVLPTRSVAVAPVAATTTPRHHAAPVTRHTTTRFATIGHAPVGRHAATSSGSAAPAAAATTAVPTSGSSTSGSRGAQALAAARTKLGDPYVYGATGPSSFDCSGLTQWAYKQVGVSLPRTASAQSSVGQEVSIGNLQPGDLVFFYNLGHVGIYAGNGMILHAPTEGENVKLTPMKYLGDPVTARRP